MSMFDEKVYKSLADFVAGEFFGHASSNVLKMTGELYQAEDKGKWKEKVPDLFGVGTGFSLGLVSSRDRFIGRAMARRLEGRQSGRQNFVAWLALYRFLYSPPTIFSRDFPKKYWQNFLLHTEHAEHTEISVDNGKDQCVR